jgi:hypothetical protein
LIIDGVVVIIETDLRNFDEVIIPPHLSSAVDGRFTGSLLIWRD